MENLATIVCVFITIVFVILFIIRSRMRYWKKRQIPHDEPYMFFGNMKATFQNSHPCELVRNLYQKYKGTGPFCGIYFFLMSPAVLVLNLDLAKKVLVQDFSNFTDRGIYFNEKSDPLSAHIICIEGTKWRQLRTKLATTFTPNKMKLMFPLVMEVGHRLVQTLSKIPGEKENCGGEIIEVKDLNARFTIDVIGTCVFGIECNSVTDPNTYYREFFRSAAENSNHNILVNAFIESYPNLARKLRMRTTPNYIEEFFMKFVRETVEYREKNDIQRNDFMSLLIDLKNKKQITTDDGQIVSTGITMNELAANAFMFYLAGFETSASTMSFAMYELARNIVIQDKLRNSINEVFEKHNGKLTYESINEMHYLDQVIDETLRMYPVVPMLRRIALADYSTDDPKYKIEKGSLVIIPADSIHYDPEIYPNPTKYDPERFSPDEKSKRPSSAFLGFGDGPRNCIGLRFGRMQVRIGLALMIKNFKFSWCEETQKVLKFDPKKQFLSLVGGIHLKVEKIKY